MIDRLSYIHLRRSVVDDTGDNDFANILLYVCNHLKKSTSYANSSASIRLNGIDPGNFVS